MSAAEVDELIKPTDEALELVHEWLADNGIERSALEYNSAKDWVKLTLPVSEVERILDCKYSVFKHEDGTHLVRAPVWSLPLNLHEHVDTIQPTNSFFRPMKRGKQYMKVDAAAPKIGEVTAAASPDVGSVCNPSAVTPQCLRTLYGTINYTPKAAGANKVGLNDFLREANNRSDTQIFLEQFRPDAVSAAETFQVVIINNGDDQQTPDTPAQRAAGKDLEGNLDIETILGIDYPTPAVAFTTGGSPPFNPDLNTPTDTNEPYVIWLNYVLGTNDIPQVISTSYGDDEQTVPRAYATKACRMMAQLGARGTSLFFASGDSGVGPQNPANCKSNDGKNTTMFIPSFPAGCPFVTVVGATKNFNPEVVALDTNGFSSGGGFSNYFKRPAYQNLAVKTYINELGSEFAGLYNTSGRGYPDISAQGQRYVVTWFGMNVLLDGTSASTPCAAAVTALVNDALIAAGKPPLGFLNPFLYKSAYSTFTDITSGSAIGCGTAGFPALAGWDAVSGFGTPVSTTIS